MAKKSVRFADPVRVGRSAPKKKPRPGFNNEYFMFKDGRKPSGLAGEKILQDMKASTEKSQYTAPSREGKVQLSAWLDPEYKSNMRAIQMHHPLKSLQDLYAEALDDLFAKYSLSASDGDQKSSRNRR